VTKWGKCKFYFTVIQYKIKTGPSHKLVLMFLFGREEKWSTKTVYGIGVHTVYMLCSLSVCVGVLATLSGQQMVHCSCLTSPTQFIISNAIQLFLLEE
jgi:hypothetical protein